MAWYYFLGKTSRPIPTGNNDVVSCSPGYYIEIVSANSVVTRLINQRALRRCGPPPKGAKVAFSFPVKDVKLADVLPQTDFAKSIKEYGKKTPEKTEVPKKVVVSEIAEPEKTTRKSRSRKTKQSDEK